MSSKTPLPPWEFVRRHPTLLPPGEGGVFVFHCYDPWLQKILLNKIPGKVRPLTLIAAELSASWVREKLAGRDLFAGQENYLILNAENLDQEAADALLRVDFGQRFALLAFSKTSKLFTWLKGRTPCLQVAPPKFWESDKLLGFLCRESAYPLPSFVSHYLLQALPGEVGDFADALARLSLNCPDPKALSLEQAKEIIGQCHLDQFKLADLLSERKRAEFFHELLQTDWDVDSCRSLFAFLQTHLLKIASPGLIRKKPRLSRYDRKILDCSSLWETAALRRELRLMGELEILAKQRGPLLARLRELYINCR